MQVDGMTIKEKKIIHLSFKNYTDCPEKLFELIVSQLGIFQLSHNQRKLVLIVVVIVVDPADLFVLFLLLVLVNQPYSKFW